MISQPSPYIGCYQFCGWEDCNKATNNKTAVTGISWGGFQTCIVSGIDNRFKAAAPVYGCAFHDEIIFKRHFINMSKESKELWMNKIDPKNYIVYSQCPTLFINGNKDGCFDIQCWNF